MTCSLLLGMEKVCVGTDHRQRSYAADCCGDIKVESLLRGNRAETARSEFSQVTPLQHEIKVAHFKVDLEHQQIATWLSPVDPRQIRDKVIQIRTEASGIWFTESRVFQNWRNSMSSSVLWLNGISMKNCSHPKSYPVNQISCGNFVFPLFKK